MQLHIAACLCDFLVVLKMNTEIIQLEPGWQTLKTEGIDKLEYFLDNGAVPPATVDQFSTGNSGRLFGPNSYSKLYTYVFLFYLRHSFRMVYNMCTQKAPYNWSEKLYIRYGESLSHYVQQKVLPCLIDKSGLPLLVELKKKWTNHKLYVKWMDRFFQYLDRYYVKLRSAEPMNTKGLRIFKSLVFDPIAQESTHAILNLINQERDGVEVPEDVLHSVIEMYMELGVGGQNLSIYQKEFEEALLPATAAFYADKAQNWLQFNDLPEYLVLVERALTDEDSRTTRYLHPSTLLKLRGVTIMQLLQEPQKVLLTKPTGISALLSANRLEDLARMYRMFALVDGGLVPAALGFRAFVTVKGTALVDAREAELKAGLPPVAEGGFIDSLIALHEGFKQIVRTAFASDTLFQKSLKEAFEVFVNRDSESLSMPLLMSSFCDRVLKTSGERFTDEAMEEAITKLVELFSFLSEKDEFCEIYRNQLAKRLLTDSSASEDAEKSLIQKLKMKCGANFTSKLEGMITDLTLASDMSREFRAKDEAGFDFSVTVLTTGFWPTYLPIETVLAPAMKPGIDRFESFYTKRTQHRRLQWIHSLGMVTLGGRFGQAKFDLVMNTYQGLILLLFNDNRELTLQQICEALKLEEAFAKKLVATLVFSKFKILKKVFNEETKSVELSDILTVNDEFTVAHRKIKIPPPTVSVEETHNKSKVEEDRSFAIEAAIVRVMKTRKLLQHPQLVLEISAQLTLFKPTTKAIKARIDNLVDREFIERDPDNPNLYKYLA